MSEVLEARIVALEARVARLEKGGGAAATTLPDVDIDGQYGDPAVRKMPPRWTGDDFTGAPFSQCSPKFLRFYAEFLIWRAGKENEVEEKKKYARYSLLDAARARAWAARIEATPNEEGMGDEPLPF